LLPRLVTPAPVAANHRPGLLLSAYPPGYCLTHSAHWEPSWSLGYTDLGSVIARRRLTQTAAAEKLGINQPKVSALANYKLDGFSVGRLMTFLAALDQDVEIVIKEKPRSRAAGRISVAGSERPPTNCVGPYGRSSSVSSLISA
jgi:hypothetical protein